VSQFGLAIYMKPNLEAKEELWKLKYFTMQKYFKKASKTFKILQLYKLISSFNTSQIIIFSKILI
jgi:hypothetical protein